METVHAVFGGQFLKDLRSLEHLVNHIFRILHGVVPAQSDQVFGRNICKLASNGHAVCFLGFNSIRGYYKGEIIGWSQVPLSFG